MPKGIFNWKFREVENFLKENNFRLNHTNGSHFYYVGSYEGRLRQVCIPFHSSKAIKPRTMRGIILQSGIPQNKWTKK